MNLEEKYESNIMIKIDPTWLSYHVMMPQFYEPLNKTSCHIDNIVEYLNYTSKNLLSEFPDITKSELNKEVHYFTSCDMIEYFEKVSKYKKSYIN